MAVTGAPAAPRVVATLGHDGRPARALRRDASANLDRILAVARRMFAERGSEVRMEDVAAEAGVGKGTLYRRCASRAELAQAVLDEITRDFQRDVLAGFGTPDEPALARLEVFLQRLAEFGREHGTLLVLSQDGTLGGFRTSPAYDWKRQVIAGLLAEAARAGECPPQDLDFLPDALLALLCPGLMSHLAAERGVDAARALAGVRALLSGATGRVAAATG